MTRVRAASEEAYTAVCGYDPGDPAEETGEELTDAEIETLTAAPDDDLFSRAAERDRARNLALRDRLGLPPGGGALR